MRDSYHLYPNESFRNNVYICSLDECIHIFENTRSDSNWQSDMNMGETSLFL